MFSNDNYKEVERVNDNLPESLQSRLSTIELLIKAIMIETEVNPNDND